MLWPLIETRLSSISSFNMFLSLPPNLLYSWISQMSCEWSFLIKPESLLNSPTGPVGGLQDYHKQQTIACLAAGRLKYLLGKNWHIDLHRLCIISFALAPSRHKTFLLFFHNMVNHQEWKTFCLHQDVTMFLQDLERPLRTASTIRDRLTVHNITFRLALMP
jgi:hypothetical protein